MFLLVNDVEAFGVKGLKNIFHSKKDLIGFTYQCGSINYTLSLLTAPQENTVQHLSNEWWKYQKLDNFALPKVSLWESKVNTKAVRLCSLISNNHAHATMSDIELYIRTVIKWHKFFCYANPGVTGAKAGTLTFMIGGKEEAYERAKEILQHMGKSFIHTGTTGTGQVRSKQLVCLVLCF